MDKSIKAGILGFSLAFIINIVSSPVYLYFVPAFLATILVIYVFGLRTLKDGLVAAFMTYIFNEGILSTISYASYYLANEPYPAFNIEVWMIFYPIVFAVTAVVAGYVGVLLAQTKKPAPEPSPTIPQDMQTV
jgi:hypothetical protein